MLNKVQIIVACCILLVVSCDSYKIFDEYKSVNGSWQAKNIVEFSFTFKDTIESYDQQLISIGTPIYKERSKFMTTFIPIFKKYYSDINKS